MTGPTGRRRDAAWCTVLTPPAPGAIAIIELGGPVAVTLATLTGRSDWREGRLRLVRIEDIDDGLAARTGATTAEIMPHGGPRIVQRIVRRLAQLGHRPVEAVTVDPVLRYPESRHPVEAAMLAVLAEARSPLAIDLLLDQPRRWRQPYAWTAADEARSRRLDRLVEPPVVVVAGPPNVGKSTLSNRLLGRSAAIVQDRPGTTRDYTAGLVELGGLAVRWHDTPGLRTGGDAIEQRAAILARRLMTGADLLVALTDDEHPWAELPRAPDLRVASKADLAVRSDADLAVSAATGAGLAALAERLRDLLVPPGDLRHSGPWRFHPLLGRRG